MVSPTDLFGWCEVSGDVGVLEEWGNDELQPGNSKLIEIIRFWSVGLFINILSCLNRKKWNRR